MFERSTEDLAGRGAGLGSHAALVAILRRIGVNISGPLGVVRILVPAAQAEEATRIFAELDFSDEPADDAGGEIPEWRVPGGV